MCVLHEYLGCELARRGVRRGAAEAIAAAVTCNTPPPLRIRNKTPGAKVCRYSRHSAGSLCWPFPALKFEFIFQTKYTEAILTNNTRKLLRFEITEILVAVEK